MDLLCRRQSALFMHYLRTVHGTHNYFIQKKIIKNGSHNTIHTFKNYFAIVFLVFSKISCIQTDPKAPATTLLHKTCSPIFYFIFLKKVS